MIVSLSYTGTPVSTWFSKYRLPKKVTRGLYSEVTTVEPDREGNWTYRYFLGPFCLVRKLPVQPPLVVDRPPDDSYFHSPVSQQRNNWRTRIILRFEKGLSWKPSKDKKNFGRTWTYYRCGPITIIRRSRARNFDPSTAPMQTYEKFLLFGLVCFFAYLLWPVISSI